MEMDIPIDEELEWLEADLYQDYLDEDLEPPLLHEEKEQEQEEEVIEDKSEPKKRVRSNLLDPINIEDKRCKIDITNVIEDDDDEDEWLRYAPPPREEVEEVVVVDEEEKEKEKFISRYATDIEGDFMPVTAPDGVRVYAKLIDQEIDDKYKKLDVKAPLKGRLLLN